MGTMKATGLAGRIATTLGALGLLTLAAGGAFGQQDLVPRAKGLIVCVATNIEAPAREKAAQELRGMPPAVVLQALRSMLEDPEWLREWHYPYRLVADVALDCLPEADVLGVYIDVMMHTPDQRLVRDLGEGGVPGPDRPTAWTATEQLAARAQDPQVRLAARKGFTHLASGSDSFQAFEPQTALGFLYRGMAYYYQATYRRGGRQLKPEALDQALPDFGRAIALDPGLAEAYLRRGQVLSLRRRYEEAVRDLDKAIQLDGSVALAFKLRAEAHAALGHDAQATPDRETGERLQREAQEAYLRSPEGLERERSRGDMHARACLSGSDTSPSPVALEAYDNILRFHPEQTSYCVRRAMLYWFFGDDDKALADLNAYIEQNHDAAYPHYLKARIHKKRGDQAAATADLAACRERVEARPRTTIKLPDLPQDLPTTNLGALETQALAAKAGPADVVTLAQVAASTNANDVARECAVKALAERYDAKALAPAEPYLELLLHRRPTQYYSVLWKAVDLLGRLGTPDAAAILAEFACSDYQHFIVIGAFIPKAIAKCPADVAVSCLTYVLLHTPSSVVASSAAAELATLTGRPGSDICADLIVRGSRQEQIAPASAIWQTDPLGRLTLFEIATDPDTEAPIRAQALERLRRYGDPLVKRVADRSANG
jgi:tetratricopeptide (TPR) repeat protein